ncbi:MAG TPA: DUF3536 domain-containing protein, partial [Anaerolineaceae bacterium]|nr:DUF3536 domain-containing protein [Anaerolineaceae bacterium]
MTGQIPDEAGAAPYRNWNEKIHAECYRPNAELGNFEKISFNMGPTLLEWMADFDPQTYRRILDQDGANVRRHAAGNAMAQAYNHTILPLATRQDKITQVKWGIADFEFRFQRRPKGMWLPETAVDLETLEVLAENDIAFTILAPWQAAVDRVDPTQPYQVDLPSGRSIVVFFYDQDVSTRVSFDPGATTNADQFLLNYILPKYAPETQADARSQLVVVASDGELYGHHQPFRDKFLARLMDGALEGKDLQPTFPELWLKENPVKSRMQIRENTSWSCHHGVMRWRGECGCTPGSAWKAPFRQALNQIAGLIDSGFTQAVRPYIPDPWALRNAYIQVILGNQTSRDLIRGMAKTQPDEDGLRRIELLLEGQYQRQRMF